MISGSPGAGALYVTVDQVESLIRRRLVAGDYAGDPLRERIRRIASEECAVAPERLNGLVGSLVATMAGLGPLEVLLADPEVSEVMVNGPAAVYVERHGRLERTDVRFPADAAVLAMIERIVGPLGLRVDESTPMVDPRLPDGSRFNAVVPPLALDGPTCCIRRFVLRCDGFDDLVAEGTCTADEATYLTRAVQDRRSVLVSGGTSSGKTTMLNVLSTAIPEHERVVTIEDAAELRLAREHVVRLEARPPNGEGLGEVTVRDLVRNALRMRPDRVVVGEVRGGEALDMLTAMTTGHDGSLGTVHTTTPDEAVSRLESMVLTAERSYPIGALRRLIAAAVDVIVQLRRDAQGRRRVVAIAEIDGLGDAGEVQVRPVEFGSGVEACRHAG